MHTTWRERMMPLIADVLDACQRLSLKEKQAALRKANPYRGQECWMTRIWRDECKIQLGLKRRSQPKPFQPAKGQKVLFESGKGQKVLFD